MGNTQVSDLSRAFRHIAKQKHLDILSITTPNVLFLQLIMMY